MKRILLLIIAAVLVTAPLSFGKEASPLPEVPVKGMVTLVDLGAKSCIPCKMMAPILEELKEDYRNRAEIIFIDVWKHPKESKKFTVSMIPTQIFFNREGKEIYRHVGFLDKQSIIDRLEYMLENK